MSFDFAVEEIFPTLISGATLVLRPETLYGPTDQFLRFIADQRISILDLPTAFWHTWVDELPQQTLGLPESLRLVIVGGEKASAESLAIWRERVSPRIQWVNGYGPTETTVIATSWEAGPGDETQIHGDIPIGRPIANTRLYVVDPYLEPCPVGVAGELLIAGDGLARGYLNRAELTRAKFINHAFGDGPAERLYRSGDLVKYLPDGCLVFLGRQDHQVKIRGFRIEMAEIENALEQHAGVSRALVIAAGAGDKRLVAYYSPAGTLRPSAGELSGFLRSRLPEFMIPPDFLPVERFPLTPNGKIDRGRLPLPDGRRPEQQAGYVAPRTATEEALTQIWSQLLAIAPIGINDNFFSLGGHSLLATKLASRIKSRWGIELPLRLVFERPTVAGLALAVTEIQASDLSSDELAGLIQQIEMLDENQAKGYSVPPDRADD
jgi:acyl-coenzyme A synthetase/AMP-(fatty) acid ligase